MVGYIRFDWMGLPGEWTDNCFCKKQFLYRVQRMDLLRLVKHAVPRWPGSRLSAFYSERDFRRTLAGLTMGGVLTSMIFTLQRQEQQ